MCTCIVLCFHKSGVSALVINQRQILINDNDTVMKDLFSHHRRNLPHRGRAHIIAADMGVYLRPSYRSPGLTLSSSQAICVLCTLYENEKAQRKSHNYLKFFLFGGLLIPVHSLEESGIKYTWDFPDLLYPQEKLPRAMSHEMSISLSCMSCQHKIPLNLF